MRNFICIKQYNHTHTHIHTCRMVIHPSSFYTMSYTYRLSYKFSHLTNSVGIHMSSVLKQGLVSETHERAFTYDYFSFVLVLLSFSIIVIIIIIMQYYHKTSNIFEADTKTIDIFFIVKLTPITLIQLPICNK